jgi:hypothetical protein
VSGAQEGGLIKRRIVLIEWVVHLKPDKEDD